MVVTTNGKGTLELNIPEWRMELDDMKERLKFQEPQWGPVGKDVYERTYSRKDAEGKAETWIDTCYRTVAGNLALVDPRFIEKGEAARLLESLFDFRFVPAGRHLSQSGIPGRQFLFNCHRAGFGDRFSRHFEFVFNELMKGGGVGANYSNRFIDRYPAIANTVAIKVYIPPEYEGDDIKVLKSRRLIEVDTENNPVYPPPAYQVQVYRVQDSREGWYGALDRLLEAYFLGQPVTLAFDLSMLRPKGSIIKGFGGISSGPWALATMLRDISVFLNTRVGKKLSSVDFMYVVHLISACVVAGNVRRSARMSIKHWMDPDIMDFIFCKTNSEAHWSTNISVEVDNAFWYYLQLSMDEGTDAQDYKLHEQAQKVFVAICKGMLTNGEPGFVNTSLAHVGERGDVSSTNPCGEIFLEEFENCNLGHVNLGAFWNDHEGAIEAFRLTQRYLIRATFGDITDPDQRAVVDRNRRTGVGIFGYQAWVNKRGVKYSRSHEDKETRVMLSEYKQICIASAKAYAEAMGIPEPIKHTTFAPTGTTAKMPGTTEGAQNIFARYFLRRMRFGADDPKVARYFAEGYDVEDDVYVQDTKVVTFPVKDQLVADIEGMGMDADTLVEDASEVSLDDFLAIQAMLQEVYVDNSISLTINVQPDTSLTKLALALAEYGPRVKGTTIMPEMTRPQMPYERITKEQFEATGMGRVGQGEMDCATGACPVK